MPCQSLQKNNEKRGNQKILHLLTLSAKWKKTIYNWTVSSSLRVAVITYTNLSLSVCMPQTSSKFHEGDGTSIY